MSCGDGEETRVRALGDFIDKHVQDLSKSMPTASDTRLMLMAALLIADELETAVNDRNAAQRERGDMEALVSEAENRQLHHDTVLANNAQDMNLLADRIHDLVDKVRG